MTLALPEWTVSERPLSVAPSDPVTEALPLPGYRAIVRDDTEEVLSIVRGHYEVIQNKDAFGFLRGLPGEVETVSVGKGHVLVLYKLIRHMGWNEQFANILDPYLCVINSFNGRALQIIPTTIRFSCTNVLDMGLGAAGWKIDHVAGANERLLATQEVVERAIQMWPKRIELMAALSKTTCSPGEAEVIINQVCYSVVSPQTTDMILNKYRQGTETDLFAVLNAITHWIMNKRRSKIWYNKVSGVGKRMLDRSWRVLTAAMAMAPGAGAGAGAGAGITLKS